MDDYNIKDEKINNIIDDNIIKHKKFNELIDKIDIININNIKSYVCKHCHKSFFKKQHI